MFLADCFTIARSISHGAKLTSEARQELMRAHSAAFADLSAEQRSRYTDQALMQNNAKRDMLRDEERSLQDEVDLARLRAGSVGAGRSPWTLAACKTSIEDRNTFETMCAGAEFSRKRVEALRQRAREAPPAPDILVKLAIGRQQISMSMLPPRPQWIGRNCAQREHFVGQGLLVRDGSREVPLAFYKVLYAYQSPISLCVWLACGAYRRSPSAAIAGSWMPCRVLGV